MGGFGEPVIPGFLLKPMTAVKRSAGGYDASKGGQWMRDEGERAGFKGALLPMSNEDLQTGTQGGYTRSQQKIYTNGFSLEAGQTVEASDGEEYVVVTELTHTYIHGMRRYIVERKGERAQ